MAEDSEYRLAPLREEADFTLYPDSMPRPPASNSAYTESASGSGFRIAMRLPKAIPGTSIYRYVTDAIKMIVAIVSREHAAKLNHASPLKKADILA